MKKIMKKGKQAVALLLGLMMVLITIPVNTWAGEVVSKTAAKSPKVLVDSVTWEGGRLEIPIDLGGYKRTEIGCGLYIYDEKANDTGRHPYGEMTQSFFNVKNGLWSLSDHTLAVSLLENFWSCDVEQLYSKKGTYTVEVTFTKGQEPLSSEEIGKETLKLVIPKDSQIWYTPETRIKFDENKDVVLHFQNGTNYYKLQSIKTIEIFTGKGNVGAPYPVLTKGFKADMSAGILTIDRDELRDAVKEYVNQGGWLGEEVFLNATAESAAGEEIRYFNTIDRKDESGSVNGATTAWKLDVTDLRKNLKDDPSVVPASKTKVTLSPTTYTYNGKVRKPEVTVKDKSGKVIAKNNYTVTYDKGCKNVGRYKVRVDFKGSYIGSVIKTFEIKPQNTGVPKVTAIKKGFTAKWKTQTKQTTGYQIQYSTDKKFKTGNRQALVGKNKTSQSKVKGLKANKKYYVRIRTYKDVKANGNTVRIYSDWSKARAVTVKK